MASKSSTKKQQVQQAKSTEAVAKAGSMDLTKTLSLLSQSGVQIQSTLSGIQEQIVQKFADLQALDGAIKVKKEEMEKLHGVDSTLLSLDEAKAQHQTELDAMEKEREEKQAEFDEQFRQLEQQRQREEEQYAYNLRQKRKQDDDIWLEQVRTNQNVERDRKERFEKDLATREEALKVKENDYKAALNRFSLIDDEVKSRVDAEVAKVSGAIKRDFEHKTQIADVQHNAEIQKLTFENQRLQQQAALDSKTITDLREALAKAYEKNTELAAKAVDSAANTKAVADMQALFTNTGGAGNGTRTRS